MSNYIVDGTDLTSVANAIRTKGGTSAALAFPAGFVSAIAAISGAPDYGIFMVQHGTVTPASNVSKLTITVDPDIGTKVWATGYIPNTQWPNYEGDANYDNKIAGWQYNGAKNYFASNVLVANTTFAFLSSNANGHTYKTGGSSFSGNTYTVGNLSGYQFIGGETYHYLIVGVT